MEKTILVVEDDRDIRENLALLLDSEGYRVQMASNGRHALEMLKSAEDDPSVILLDLMMPIMDGYGFRTEQERDPRLAAIPVILMTANSQIEAVQQRIGADAFVRKPIDIDAFVEVVRKFA